MTRPRIHRFDVVASTNDIALGMARDGAPDGTVALAAGQTAGRGRRGRVWLDVPGDSVLMSVVAARGRPAGEAYRLCFAASLAVRDCLREFCGVGDVLVKWPNDVLARGRKIAGILIETTTTRAGGSGSDPGQPVAVAGIGINVGQREFPDELGDTATSVLIETGESPVVEVLAVQVAQAFLDLAESAEREGFEEILSRWMKCMWGLGRQVEVDTGERVIKGCMGGVNAQGSLLIVDAAGRTDLIHAADSIRVLS